MHCEGKFKLRSHNISYCLIEVVTKAGLTNLIEVVTKAGLTMVQSSGILNIVNPALKGTSI